MITFSALVSLALAAPAEQALDREELAQLQTATARLIVELEFIGDDLKGEPLEKNRNLHDMAEGALEKAKDFQRGLQANENRRKLTQPFDEMDAKVQELVQAVQKAKPAARTLGTITRAASTDDEICYLLFVRAGSADRTGQLISRQAAAFLEAAKELERSQNSGPKRGDAGIMEPSVQKLIAAAGRFQKAALLKDKDQLKEDFAVLNQAWEQVVLDLQKLSPTQNAQLLRSAGRLDQIHDRLFRLLGVEGKRAGLIVGA
jgi:hypothetical protein